MKYDISRTLTVGALVAMAAMATGCATSGSIDEVRAMAEEASSAARTAEQSADQAQSTAESAQQTANAAKSTADSAAQAAQEARSCCEANTERLDRMFQRSQQK